MQESQLLYLLMTLSIGHPANAVPPTPQTIVRSAPQTAPFRLDTLRCPHGQKVDETGRCRIKQGS